MSRILPGKRGSIPDRKNILYKKITGKREYGEFKKLNVCLESYSVMCCWWWRTEKWYMKLYNHNKEIVLIQRRIRSHSMVLLQRMIWLDLYFTETTLNGVLRMFWEEVGGKKPGGRLL